MENQIPQLSLETLIQLSKHERRDVVKSARAGSCGFDSIKHSPPDTTPEYRIHGYEILALSHYAQLHF